MIYNLGSINADHIYRLSHLPQPGETIAADAFETGLGGKGANMSVAAVRAEADVRHIGAIGKDGRWALERLGRYGVDASSVQMLDAATGHAIINVDAAGENAIVIFPGANQMQSEDHIRSVLSNASSKDVLLLQNETNLGPFCAEIGSEIGMRVIYAAAPFEAKITADILPFANVLILNETELSQLTSHLKTEPENLPISDVIVTKGAEGAMHYSAGTVNHFPAPKVNAVDTTGAGDTFTGYFAAGLDQGLSVDHAISRANVAAALMVTKKGTADAVPDLEEVNAFAN
ncbi:MAG: ribokinase [Pseudomonadota bacterium]